MIDLCRPTAARRAAARHAEGAGRGAGGPASRHPQVASPAHGASLRDRRRPRCRRLRAHRGRSREGSAERPCACWPTRRRAPSRVRARARSPGVGRRGWRRPSSSGIHEAGGDVLLAGVEPTPAIAFLTIDAGADAGVVISASHNPPEYNGIKFFGPDGMKLPDGVEDKIEAALGRLRRRSPSARARSGSSRVAASDTWRTSWRRPELGSTG